MFEGYWSKNRKFYPQNNTKMFFLIFSITFSNGVEFAKYDRKFTFKLILTLKMFKKCSYTLKRM